MTDEEMPVGEEHFESIPWSALLPQANDRSWLVYVAAGAVVALVLGVVAARRIAPTQSPESQALAQPPVPVESTTTTALISEADLLAGINPYPGSAAAAMRAEWFVTDYFTIDGAGGREAELAGALGGPAPPSDPAVTTYVEWARAWDAVPEGDGRYRVPVAFRSITSTAAGFVRGLVRAVVIEVRVGPDGGTRVLDLPEPTELPDAPVSVSPPPSRQVPGDVASIALNRAAAWGDSASVIDGTYRNGTWRVRVEVADEHGTPWLVVVPVEGAG